MKIIGKSAVLLSLALFSLQFSGLVKAQVSRFPEVYMQSTTGLDTNSFYDATSQSTGKEIQGLESVNLLERKAENQNSFLENETRDESKEVRKTFGQRVLSWLNSPIKNPTVLAWLNRAQVIESRFGMSAIFRREADAITVAVWNRDVLGVFKQVGKVLVKEAVISTGALALGASLGVGYSFLTTGTFIAPASLKALGSSVATKASQAWKGVKNGLVWVKGAGIATWKFIDNSTKSLARVANRVSNSINKIITVVRDARLEFSGLAKAVNSWRKIIASAVAFLTVGSGLSLYGEGQVSVSSPNQNTAQVKVSGGVSSGGKTSTAKTGSAKTESPEDSDKKISEKTGGATKDSSAMTKVVDGSLQNKASGSEQVKPALATSEKISKVKTEDDGIGSGATLALASGVKTASVKAETSTAKAVSEGASSGKTTQAKLSVPAGLSTALKSLNSNLNKATKEIAKIAKWDVPKFMSAGFFPKGDSNTPATTYQKVTIAVWTTFFALLVSGIALWLYGKFKKEDKSEELEKAV